jgi:glyoxylase-like metal-dependent hydrolase (beta-lactamase superfamily II)
MRADADWYKRAVTLDPIDLRHMDVERVIGVYLLETPDGLALHDCGPTSCIATLKSALAERDLALTDLRHLLLSHIHLDHAGAAGVLVREHPDLRVHVSEVGAPHLVEPARLERSARRLYGDAFDTLWGELAPVPAENVEVVGPRVVGLDCFAAPGHASHQVVYLDEAGVAYTGDAAGVRILPGRLALPPTPPPDVDVEAWERTFDELVRRTPTALALTHFGVADDPADHLERLREHLRAWTARVGEPISEADFVREARQELEAAEPDHVEAYERAMPLWQTYAGLQRYWDKKRAAA